MFSLAISRLWAFEGQGLWAGSGTEWVLQKWISKGKKESRMEERHERGKRKELLKEKNKTRRE